MAAAIPHINDDYGKYLIGELLKQLATLFNEIGPKALEHAERLSLECLRKFQRWIMIAEEWTLEQKLEMIKKYKELLQSVIEKVKDPPEFWKYLVRLAGVAGVALLGWSGHISSAVVFFVTQTGVVGGFLASVLGVELITTIALGFIGGVGVAVACICIYYGCKAIKIRFFDYDEQERKKWFSLVSKWFGDAEKKLRDYYKNGGGDGGGNSGGGGQAIGGGGGHATSGGYCGGCGLAIGGGTGGGGGQAIGGGTRGSGGQAIGGGGGHAIGGGNSGGGGQAIGGGTGGGGGQSIGGGNSGGDGQATGGDNCGGTNQISRQQMLDQVVNVNTEVVEEESSTAVNVQVPQVLGGVNVQYGNSTRTVTRSATSTNRRYHVSA